MILTGLKNFYDRVSTREDGPPPFGYAEIGVVAAINLDRDGNVTGLSDLREDGKASKTNKPQSTRMTVPQPPKRTVKITPGFLVDNAGYLLGFDNKDNPARAIEQFDASKTLHHQLLDGLNDPDARTVLAFFDRWSPADAEALLADEPEEMATGWLILRRASDGALMHEQPALQRVWEASLADNDAPHGQCLVTGEDDVALPSIHPAIKGVPGAQSSGAALVSFNLPAFTSYGKAQNLNAPIGAETAFAYTTALNYLLRPDSPQKLRIGDTMLLVWASVDTPAETSFLALFTSNTEKLRDAEEQSVTTTVHDRLSTIAMGKWAEEPDFKNAENIQFFVLGLAPNAARLQIRFFLTDTLGVLLQRVQQHCRDLLFEPPGIGVRVPSLWVLVNELLPKDENGQARRAESDQRKLDKIAGDLMRAILSGHMYPQTLLPTVLARLRSDHGYTTTRFGMIKAFLNRQARFAGQPPEEEIKMTLDDTNEQPGYLLGRLFAVLENVQILSRPKDSRGPTIRDRYAAAASVTPRAVFPHLLRLSGSHIRKAKRDRGGLARSREEEIDAIGARLSAQGGFASQLDLKQQGLFFIGYYQQKEALFTKGSKSNTRDNTDDEVVNADDPNTEE